MIQQQPPTQLTQLAQQPQQPVKKKKKWWLWLIIAIVVIAIIIIIIIMGVLSKIVESNKVTNELVFTKIHDGNYKGKTFNLYFFNYGYNEEGMGGIEQFSKDVDVLVLRKTDKLKGFIEAEPFKSYKNRFNIYRINLLGEDIIPDLSKLCDPYNPCPEKKPDPDHIVRFIADKYSIADKYIIPNGDNSSTFKILLIPGNPEGVSIPYLGATCCSGGLYLRDPINQDIERGIINFFHEFGHTFAGISHEYLIGYVRNRIYPENPPSGNCDLVPGCPRWCEGNPTSIQRTGSCLNITTKDDCDVFVDDVTDFFEEGGFCVWIDDNPEITDFFGSKCILGFVDYGNIGNSCIEGTGCYYGCAGVGWRSSYRSLYAGFFGLTYPEYSQGGLYPYNKIQQDMIIEYIESTSVSGDYISGETRQGFWNKIIIWYQKYLDN